MTVVRYNLLFAGQALAAPYAGAPDSAIDKNVGPDGQPVPLRSSYHHVIPKGGKHGLMTLWDTVLAQHNVGHDAGPLLAKIALNAHNYGTTIGPADLEQAKQLVTQIKDGGIIHDPTAKRPEHWDYFSKLYIWLPGNLFTGPENRIDDPKSTLDKAAELILPAGQYQLLKGAYADIEKCVANPSKIGYAQAAYRKLAEIATYLTVRPFSSAKWTWGSTGTNKGPKVKGTQLPGRTNNDPKRNNNTQ